MPLSRHGFSVLFSAAFCCALQLSTSAVAARIPDLNALKEDSHVGTAPVHSKILSLQRRLQQASPTCKVDVYVTESTKIRNLQNTLTFSFSLSCALGPLSSIRISGIPAITRTQDTSFGIGGTLRSFTSQSSATVSEGASGLDLTIVLNRNLGASCGHTWELTLQNPASPQDHVSFSDVVFSVQHAEAAQQANWGEYVVMSDASLAQPARVLQGQQSNTFPVRRVQESSAVSGELNTLSFSLQPDFPLPVGALITIDGLGESMTPSNYWYNSSAQLSTEQGCAASSAGVEWEPSAGLCRILNPNGVCINPEGQPASVCSFHRVQVSGADSGMFGGAAEWFNYGRLVLNCTVALDPASNSTDCMPAAAPVQFAVALRNPSIAKTGRVPTASASSPAIAVDPQPLVLPPDAPYPFVLGGREGNGFVSATVREETDMVGVDNVLTFALTANVDVAAGSELHVFGLTGTRTAASTLAVHGPSAAVFTGRTAEFDRLAGTLKLAVGAAVSAGEAVEFSVAVRNQNYAINPRRVYAAMSGATFIPQRQVVGTVLASGGEIRWRAAAVSESTDVQGAASTLTLRFIPSVALPNATTITLSGLSGVTLQTTSAEVALGGAGASLFSSGAFDAAAGTLVMTARDVISNLCATELTLGVLNPTAQQPAVSLALSASGILPIPSTPLICMEVPCQTLRAAVNATFHTRAVAESSALIADANTITISLTPSLDLPPGTTVTIAGLTGAATATDAALTLSGAGATLFGGTGSWDQTTGRLVLTAGSEWAVGTSSVFSIDLTNPSSVQNATTPTVMAAADGSVACSTYGACSRNYPSLTIGPETMAGAVLSASDTPSVTTSDIGETSSVQSFVNTLTMTVALNRQIAIGSRITIAGLTGTQTYQQTWALQGTDADKFNQTNAMFNVSGGILTADFIQSVAASQTLVVAFPVINGQAAQTAVTPTVTVRDASGSALASGTFTSSVLAFSSSTLTTSATVSESTDQIGNENKIVITMQPNHAIPVGSVVTVSGLSNARRTSAGAVFTSGHVSSLGGSEAALFTSSQATWLSGSAIKLTVATEVPSGCVSTFSLQGVYNPRAPAVASSIEVAVFGTAYDFCGVGNATERGVISTVWTNLSSCLQLTALQCDEANAFFGSGQCAYPSTAAQRTITQAGLDTSGAILTANGTNSFVVALASESSDLTGHDNTISFILRPTGIIRSGETITISGLEHSLTSTTATLPLGGANSGRFQTATGIFDANAGLLTVTASVDIPSTTDTEFSITLRNPECPCVTITTFPCPNNASLTCSSSTARAAIIPSVQVTEQPYPLAKTSMQNAVLIGDKNATWLRLSVSESHSVQDVATLVSFRLASSHTIPDNEVLTISGLTGTNSDTIPLTVSDRSWYTPPVTWDQTSGVMELRATSASAPGLSLDFTACIVQRSTVQLSRSPTIQSSTVFNTPTPIPITGSGSLLAATDRVRFLVASVHESTRTRGAFNTISVSLRPNIAFGQGGALTISGLGATTHGLVDQIVTLEGPGASIFRPNATLSGAGVLSLSVVQTLPDDSTTLVQFTYQNPTGTARVATNPALTGRWRTSSGHECSLSQSPVTLVLARLQLSVANQDTPGSLTAPAWTTASVVERSRVPSTPNRLEFRVRPSHDLLQQTEILIEGLSGSATATDACLPLGGLHPDLFAGSCGSWNAGGTLALTVAAGVTISSAVDTVFSITLMNPASSQGARSPTLRAGGGSWTQTTGSPQFSGQVSVVGGDGVLTADEAARWERAWIEQDSCARGGVTQLTVILQTNAPLFPSSSVIISGLLGASSLSPTTPLTGLSSGIFGSQGVWNGAGEFTLNVSASSDPGQVLVFSFLLLNPTQDSGGVTPLVRAIGSSGTLVPSFTMTSPDGIPPWVLVAGMEPAITGAIVQSSAVFGAPNTIDLRLTTNARLMPDDTVTVSGLAASQTPTGPVVLSGADASRFTSATYNQCRGQLVLVVGAVNIPPDSTFALAVTLINPAASRESAASFVESTRTSQQELAGRVLSPSLPPMLETRNISGASPVLGNTNAVTVTLQANHVLQAGQSVTMSGFTSALESDGTVLPIATLQTAFLPSSVNFSTAASSIEVVIASDVPAFTVLTFSFPLTNPTASMYGREPLVSTGPFPSIPPTAMFHQADVLGPTRSGTWTTTAISDTVQVQGAATDVTVTVSSDSQLPPATRIIISHLVGPHLSTSPIIVSTPTGVLNDRGMWDACSGELTIIVNGTVSAGSALSFVFTTDNPFSALSPGNQPLIRAESSTVTIPATTMTLASSAFLTDLLPPTWITADISESVSVPGESNLITVTLLPSATLPQNTVVVLSGLVGTQTADNTALALQGTGRSAFASSSGSWQQGSGTLTLTVNISVPGCLDGSCSATVFAFSVLNPADAQLPGATVMVSALGPSPGMELNKTVLGGNPILGAGSTFSVGSSVSFSSEVKAAYSEINVILTPNIDISAGETLTLSGMSAFQSTSGTLTLSGLHPSHFGYNSIAERASWSSCGDMLMMTVMPGVTFGPSTADPSVEMQFTLLNPAIRTTTSLELTVGGRAKQTLRSNVVLGHKDPTWSSSFASQSSTVMTQLNTITIGFQANLKLIPGVVVTVSGLTGSHTVDSSTLPLSGSGASLFSNSQAQWTQSTGTLRMTVASGTYVTARALTTVQVDLINSDVTVTGTNLLTLEATCISTALGCVQIPLEQKQISSTILAPVTQPSFTLRVITQSANAQGERSTISVTLNANAALPAGATVTIAGLEDYSTPSDTAFTITNSLGIASGVWDQFEGTMKWDVPTGGISSGQPIVLSFTLTNGYFHDADDAPTQTVAVSDSAGFAIEAQTFQTAAISSFSHVGSFTVARLVQDTQAQGVTASFTLDVQPSYDIPAGSVLTISGLRGSRTPTTAALPLYGNGAGFYSDVGDWNQEEGTLKLTMASVMSNRYPTRVLFDLTNPARPQVSVDAYASTTVIPPQPISVEAANGFSASLLTGAVQPVASASIAETTQLQGHHNTITVSLELNAPVRTAAVIVLSNLPASQTPRDLALPIQGPSSALFGGVLAWDPCAREARLTAASLPAATALEFNFTVVNARTQQPRQSWCNSELPTCIQVSVLADDGQLAMQPSVLPSGVLSASEALVLVRSNFSIATFAPGELNNVSMTVETNALIPRDATLVVSGFTGALSPPDLIPAPNASAAVLGNLTLGMPGLIPLRDAPSHLVGNTSAWNPAEGIVVIRAVTDIPSRSTLDFSFSLLNPLPNLPRSQPHLEVVSPFFVIPRQPLSGPAFEVDTVPPTLLSLTLSGFSDTLSSVRMVNMSLALSEPSQAVCLLQRATARLPSAATVRAAGVHVQPSAGPQTNPTDTGLASAPALRGSTGWVELGPVFSGISHAVYCHYRDLAQIPNEAPEAMLETTAFTFTTPASYLPKSAATSRVGSPTWSLVLVSCLSVLGLAFAGPIRYSLSAVR